MRTQREIDVDNFAGGGGTSTGIEAATGRPVDFAINHDPRALAMHQVNHPQVRHLNQDIRDIDPLTIARHGPIRLAWFSPDCTFFSKAKGSALITDARGRASRDLPWVVAKWGQRARPRIIMVENVEEFIDWGPLAEDGRIIPERRGETFQEWVQALRDAGYEVEWKMLRACDYGAPTIRTRFILIARSDDEKIVWPRATHGQNLIPLRSAGDCIEWDRATNSIFLDEKEARAAGCRRPLAKATLGRIARGLERYILSNPNPYVVPGSENGKPFQDRSKQVQEFLIEHLRVQHKLTTSTEGQERNGARRIVVAHITHQYTSNTRGGNGEVERPLKTITTGGQAGIVQAYLIKYYSNGGQLGSCADPCPTIPTRDRIGCVTVHREQYRIMDIAFRMLNPRELFRCQGFPDEYVIDPQYQGRPMVKKDQLKMCGNSVCPQLVEALVAANCVEGH